ncbi:MAG TPA: hypothetical protein VGD26_01580 [Chitinophagaceae bacterium]
MSKHYLNIAKWVKIYVENKEEAEALTNQLHYLSCKRRRNALAAGVVIGLTLMGLIISWAS